MSMDNRLNRLEQQLTPDESQVSSDSLHAALQAMPAADRAALEQIAKAELARWADEHGIQLGKDSVKARWFSG